MEVKVAAEHAIAAGGNRSRIDRPIRERPDADRHEQHERNPGSPNHGRGPNRFAATSGMNAPTFGTAVTRKYNTVADQANARCMTTSTPARLPARPSDWRKY